MFLFGELPVFLTTFASTAIIFFFWMKRNGAKDAGKRYPPSASALSLIAAIIRGGMSALPEHFMKSAEKLGPVTSYKILGRMVIVLHGKEAIKEAFLRKSEAFADRNQMWGETNVNNPKLKGIIFARYNDAFKKYHKLSLSILKEFGFGVNSVSETRIHLEIEALNQGLLELNGRPIDPKPFTALSTFNVVSSILFGRAFVATSTCQKISEAVTGFAASHDFAAEFARVLRFVPYVRNKINAQAEFNRAILNGVEKGIEYSKKVDCETTFARRFMEIEGAGYDHQDLLFILRDLCLGSAETVSTTLQWVFVELANHPEVQTHLQKEIDAVVAKDKLPSLDDKPRLPYAEAVILEINRRRTIIPFYAPHAMFRDTEVYGYHFPKGCVVFAHGVSVHMDPKFWEEPKIFRPERFLDENNKIIGSDKVMPFSIGKRSCLGEILARQETFLFLTGLVQRFDIRPPEGQATVDVKEVMGGANIPSDFKVRLIPRTTIEN